MSFQLAHPYGRSVPRVIEKPLAAAQTFNAGALLLADASDNFAECGADPASIGAVALSGAGSDTSGFNIFGKKEFPPGKMQAVPLKTDLPFTAKYVGTLPAANGGSYGVVRDTDSDWKVDFAETVATRVKLVDRRTTSPENIARVVVEFLAANIQLL